MKTIPFGDSFIIDDFKITWDRIDAGYFKLSRMPEIQTVRINIGGERNIIYPQFYVIYVDDYIADSFDELSTGDYILTWVYGESSSSSASECFIPDPIWNLEGGLYETLINNIGNDCQIRYITTE